MTPEHANPGQRIDLDRQRQMVSALGEVLPPQSILWRTEDARPYECDGLMLHRQLPMIVVLPETEVEVVKVLQLCHQRGVPVVPRGAGTGLSGGALPHGAGVLLCLAKLNRILDVDPRARTATVQPGVRNLAISEAAATHGLYYAPDPSSQIACTIGGNVAENSGGVHCLKYGLTVHNVLRVRGVTMEGESVEFGSGAPDSPGLDLLATIIGSEGMPRRFCCASPMGRRRKSRKRSSTCAACCAKRAPPAFRFRKMKLSACVFGLAARTHSQQQGALRRHTTAWTALFRANGLAKCFVPFRRSKENMGCVVRMFFTRVMAISIP
jgi:hypothetical protein